MFGAPSVVNKDRKREKKKKPAQNMIKPVRVVTYPLEDLHSLALPLPYPESDQVGE